MATKNKEQRFLFLDLCAGIGGFHQAMGHLGGRCVGASEIDAACIDTYAANFPRTPMLGDINSIDPDNLRDFSVLCAGFPCQPFSKAGKRLGFQDESRGGLFYKILEIIDAHKEVEFILLENVRNLADRKDYWSEIQAQLAKRDFVVTTAPLILSPSDFGIPQTRQRVFILGIRSNICNKEIASAGSIQESHLNLKKAPCAKTAAFDILDDSVPLEYSISADKEQALYAWDEFRKGTGVSRISAPIWMNYFGFGCASERSFEAQCGFSKMPKWKQTIVEKNRNLYLSQKQFIDGWVARYDMQNKTKLLQKFEWNCGLDVADIKGGVIQVRQSGVRVKRPNCYPALVAMGNTPIVWDASIGHFREITPREAAKLQSFDKGYKFTGSRNKTHKQLGNAVNVRIAQELARGLFALKRE